MAWFRGLFRFGISIHALREERDKLSFSVGRASRYFNPRAPRGARRIERHGSGRRGTFQSTRSARSATPASILHLPEQPDFNPRAPRGARQSKNGKFTMLNNISIHALREERDDPLPSPTVPHMVFQSTRSARSATTIAILSTPFPSIFQSTRSARSATIQSVITLLDKLISIHALREERDQRLKSTAGNGRRISIHALREERDRRSRRGNLRLKRFQSTRSARSAT